MPRLPVVNHLRAVAAPGKAGFRIVRQSGHIIMPNGGRIITVPRNNPINAITMGGIVRDAGLTIGGTPQPAVTRLAGTTDRAGGALRIGFTIAEDLGIMVSRA